MNDISNELREKQREKYDNIIIKELTNAEILLHFIESEDEAYKYNFQGLFYPGAYFVIKKIIKTTLKGVEPQIIVDTFFHLIMHLNLFSFHKNHFPYFIEAFKKYYQIEKEKSYRNNLLAYYFYLLFEVNEKTDIEKIELEVAYDEFESIRKFIGKAISYSAYPYMRKKRDKIEPFLENNILLSRIQKGILNYHEFDKVMAASLILLLMDTSTDSKDVLINWNRKNLNVKEVWLLASFYKDFQDTEANKNILEDLYSKYPSDWIDVYQK